MQQIPQMVSPPQMLNPMMQAQSAMQQMPPQPLSPRPNPLVPSIVLKTPQAVKAQQAQQQLPETSEEFAKVLAQSMGGVRQPAQVPDQNSVHMTQKTNRQVRMVNSPPVQVGGGNTAQTQQSTAPLNSIERRSRILAERLSAMKGGNQSTSPAPSQTSKPIQTGISTTASTDVRRAALDAINRASTSPADTQQTANRAGTYSPPRKTPQPAAANQTAAQMQANETAVIKSMLLAGMTVEEIARETGIGRGAIELVQQIMRLQLGRK